jgi:glyoxylase-like metal-dependent hydrolase (beta-lactamase superfamily II)
MIRFGAFLLATATLAGCSPQADGGRDNQAAARDASDKPSSARLSLTRLDCGTATIKNFDAFFSDRPGLYPQGSREITDSCYLIRHGNDLMVWDTGLSAALKGKPPQDMGDMVVRMDLTLGEQLVGLGIKPADVDIVGISHMHPDHTGQAAQFTSARLLIGKGDFEQSKGKDDPFGAWRSAGKPVTSITTDTDVFGDGSVTALHLPGHTRDHLALLVRVPSGPVLLSGDLYHSLDARAKRGVPPFNTDRAQTLASMDRFEKLAKSSGAKVVIQHEPRDIGKLPGVPKQSSGKAI